MPQKPRSIHPDDAQDERLAALDLETAYTYAYLPTVLDDEGRAKDSPAVLNGFLWPLRADAHPTAAMDRDLAALAESGLICRYEVGGRPYLHDPRWKTRHKLVRPTPSTLPPCPEHEKSFDEVVTETVGRIAEGVTSVVEVAGSRIDQKRISDSLARLVEDVTYLVDPEKAVVNGQKVRKMFQRNKNGDADDTGTDPGAISGETE
ncbi:hypothetical protein GCM10009547_32190 [Sporichthya brevicatena]|uniref:Uncharacterized protein n=1 Tax=Sporichthya brevicatena TaxID=171442 RepID=A0ABP3S531_9ACTN